MIGHGNVAEQAGADGGRHQRGGTLHETQDMTHEVFELTSGCHGTAEGLGTDDQPDGWHHTSHATGMDEFVEHRHSCFYLVVAITSLHDTPIGRDEPFVGIGVHLMHQTWLEQYGHHGSQ